MSGLRSLAICAGLLVSCSSTPAAPSVSAQPTLAQIASATSAAPTQPKPTQTAAPSSATATAVAATTAPPTPQSFTIRGRVTEGGQPVVATVFIYRACTANSTSADGCASFAPQSLGCPRNANAVHVAQIRTTASGSYGTPPLMPGTYFVRIGVPLGTTFTSGNFWKNAPSCQDATAIQINAASAPSGVLSGIDFGS